VKPAKLLEAFGEYWVRCTSQEGYGKLMDMSGTSFSEFISNLNHLHRQVGDIMTDLSPPFFHLDSKSKNHVILTYSSKRVGLATMVIGLIKGLGKRFELKELHIDQKNTSNSEEMNKTLFNIQWIE
jgi:hypothetical protein